MKTDCLQLRVIVTQHQLPINGNQPPSVKENQPQIKVPNQNDENQNNYDTAVHPPEENSKPMPVVINETQPALQLSKPPIFTSKNSDVKEEDNNFHILCSHSHCQCTDICNQECSIYIGRL